LADDKYKEKLMNNLQCPYCKKQAVRGWELLIGQSQFWRKKRCGNCGKKIRFNSKTINLMLISLLAGIVLANIIAAIIHFDSLIINFPFLLIFFFLPFFAGKKLFMKEDKNSNGG
jgi:uncharacterized membrane protein YfcA